MNNTEPGKIEDVFKDALIESMKRAYEKCGYQESRLVHMVRDLGALRAVKRVLNRQQFLYGVAELDRCECLDCSMENLVLDDRFEGLFTESERMAAHLRLRSSGVSGSGKYPLGIVKHGDV